MYPSTHLSMFVTFWGGLEGPPRGGGGAHVEEGLREGLVREVFQCAAHVPPGIPPPQRAHQYVVQARGGHRAQLALPRHRVRQPVIGHAHTHPALRRGAPRKMRGAARHNINDIYD
eukprot:1195936-Prorocentrum_minimum.AAC.2